MIKVSYRDLISLFIDKKQCGNCKFNFSGICAERNYGENVSENSYCDGWDLSFDMFIWVHENYGLDIDNPNIKEISKALKQKRDGVII